MLSPLTFSELKSNANKRSLFIFAVKGRGNLHVFFSFTLDFRFHAAHDQEYYTIYSVACQEILCIVRMVEPAQYPFHYINVKKCGFVTHLRKIFLAFFERLL